MGTMSNELVEPKCSFCPSTEVVAEVQDLRRRIAYRYCETCLDASGSTTPGPVVQATVGVVADSTAEVAL